MKNIFYGISIEEYKEIKETLEFPSIAYIENSDDTVVYTDMLGIESIYINDEKIDLTNYLCFTALQDNSTIALNNEDNDYSPVIYYSLDNKLSWTRWNYSLIVLNEGESVYMYGDNPDKFCYYSNDEYWWSTFTMTGNIAASGNILSLISKS